MVHAVVLEVEIGVGVGARAAEPGPRAFVSSSETRFRSGDEVLGTVEDVPVAVRKWGEKVVAGGQTLPARAWRCRLRHLVLDWRFIWLPGMRMRCGARAPGCSGR